MIRSRCLKLGLGVWMLLITAASVANGQELPSDKVNALIARTKFVIGNSTITFSRGIVQGRYMEQDVSGACAPSTFPGWDFPLIRCNYKQADNSVSDGKKASVIMLNPEKDVLAKWIIATCMIVKGTNIDQCVNKLAYRIITASGSQFVVAGIVLEDINPGNGIQEAYTFRDGVTVKIQNGLPVAFTGNFGTNENNIALDPQNAVLSTASTRGPARIQSTSRLMYTAYMGSLAKDVTGTKWLGVVRELYQDAWRRAHDNSLPETVQKYRNDLMVAACYAMMEVSPPPQ